MIKLINYKGNKEGKVIYLAKSAIGEMRRDDEECITYIWSNDLQPTEYVVKETPEEILAMPDIAEGNKAIDWEQRRYDIVKIILPKLTQYGELKVSAQSVVRFVNALIEGLKKGYEK